MNVIELIAIYILIVNIVGFATMGIDKRRAIKRAWRIPEATLFTIAIFGGSLGSTVGMFLFRHKTRHWYFAYGMPIILFIHIGLIVALYLSPLQIVFL
ncbi:MAG: DUF1294 domain-containing protein [Lachnospiraceae bacterium]|nr:DUF1294 domain-containing protein [Candidatus Colinaster scatohippi]